VLIRPERFWRERDDTCRLAAIAYALVILALTKPLGLYLFRVFEGDAASRPRWLRPLEHALHRICGVDPDREQTWKEYAFALLAFSAAGLLVTYLLQRIQHLLPLNPQHLDAVPPALAFNTAASFTTNTNWQAYGGETTMSYLTQMAGLAWHNFTSAAAGIGVALALARGFTRRGRAEGNATIGNFWADVIRAIVYVLLPLSVVGALVLVSQGVIQNFSPYLGMATLEGSKQTIAMGPVASQELIKELGTNGGLPAPARAPSGATRQVPRDARLRHPAALTWTGRMAGDQKRDG
jgi:K+-transporting ATPase ATPase A chain